MDACFKAFDKDEDGFLSQAEFAALCRALFRNERGKPYPVEQDMLNNIFTIFDTNKDHVIDKDEFRHCWQNWIKQIVRPVTALVIVDVQNDFITGSLAIKDIPGAQDGLEVITPINQLLDEVRFDMVVYTLDWHPENHVSFIDNKDKFPIHESSKVSVEDAQIMDTMIFDIKGDGTMTEQKMWPRHCVMNTWGAELHTDLKIFEEHLAVYKGSDPNTDSYSAFWDNNKVSHTNLKETLDKKAVTDVYVCGIAYDVCVAATANHSIEEGYRTILLDNCSKGVCEDDMQTTRDHIIAKNGIVVQSHQVKSLVTGRDRPPCLGYQHALEIAKKDKMKIGKI
ncbi:unnamed protein product [Meganyctiphanes norvegica]|uniref:nicotinamidase n=1 Tax=Meganyctiphanes norvegica TaxID=48144 RepID=A0AAV2QJC0_MEGNR